MITYDGEEVSSQRVRGELVLSAPTARHEGFLAGAMSRRPLVMTRMGKTSLALPGEL